MSMGPFIHSLTSKSIASAINRLTYRNDLTRPIIFLIPIPTSTLIVSFTFAIGVVLTFCRWRSNRCLSNRSSSGLELDPVKDKNRCKCFCNTYRHSLVASYTPHTHLLKDQKSITRNVQ